MPPWYYDPWWAAAAASAGGGSGTQPVALLYDPAAPAPEASQELVYFVGADLPIRFAPRVPTPIVPAEWEVRVGTRTTPVLNRYRPVDSTLAADAGTGVIDALPAAAHSVAWPLATFVRVELWRVLPTLSLVPHARARLILLPTSRP